MTAEEKLEQLKKAGDKRVERYRKTRKGITVFLDNELVETFNKKLEKEGLTKTEFFRKSVEDYLK